MKTKIVVLGLMISSIFLFVAFAQAAEPISLREPKVTPLRIKGPPEIIARFKGTPVVIPLEPRKGDDDAGIYPPPGDPVAPADPAKLKGYEKNNGKVVGKAGTLVARDGQPGMRVVRNPGDGAEIPPIDINPRNAPPRSIKKPQKVDPSLIGPQPIEIQPQPRALNRVDPQPVPGDVVREKKPNMLNSTYQPPVQKNNRLRLQ